MSTTKTLASNSAPSSRHQDDGWRIIDNSHQSIVNHRLGVPLFHVLNRRNPKEKSKYLYIEEAARSKAREDEMRLAIKTTLTNWLTDTNQSEGDLKEELKKSLNSKYKKNNIQFETETPVGEQLETGDSGRTDVLCVEGYDGNDDPTIKRPVALFEVGQDNTKWWGKVAQGMAYLKLMLNDNEYKFNEPMLLVVLTLNGSKKSLKNSFLGVFLCFRSKDPDDEDIRMSLLWRMQTKNLNTLTNGLSKALYAAENLKTWRKMKLDDYESLGPNCCVVTKENGEKTVLRCYDNRFRPACRRPLIYRHAGDIFGENNQAMRSFRMYADADTEGSPNDQQKNDPFNFDASYPMSDGKSPVHPISWIWKFLGKLTLIEIPYIEGMHGPSTLGDFLPVIRKLQHFHENRYVHGDIRLLNMLFHKGIRSATLPVEDSKKYKRKTGTDSVSESNRKKQKMLSSASGHNCLNGGTNHFEKNVCQSTNCAGIDLDRHEVDASLIDFDYSGRIGVVKYPVGYVTTLVDGGLRCVKPGQLISIREDWNSMAQVILTTQNMRPPESTPENIRKDLIDRRERLKEDFEVLAHKDDDTLVLEKVNELITLVTDMASWTCSLKPAIEFMLNRDYPDVNPGATSSPPKGQNFVPDTRNVPTAKNKLRKK